MYSTSIAHPCTAQALRSIMYADPPCRHPLVKKAFKKLLSSIPMGTTPATRLDQITKATVEAARKAANLMQLPRWRNWWSPDMLALQQALHHIVTIRRHVYGYQQRTKWTTKTSKRGLAKVLEDWQQHLKLITQTHPTDPEGQFQLFFFFFFLIHRLCYSVTSHV